MPPPASQMLKPWPLWSRPHLSPSPSVTGRRPISPPQCTSVVSSKPALLEILHQRRARLVGAAADGGQRLANVRVLSHGCPPRNNCTNRTPRSTSRRAIRQRVPYSAVSGRRDRTASCVASVSPTDVERLLGGGLHPRGQLVAGDAGLQIGLARMPLEMLPIQLGQEAPGSAAAARRASGPADRDSRSAARAAGSRSPETAAACQPFDQLRTPSTGSARRIAQARRRPAGPGFRSPARSVSHEPSRRPPGLRTCRCSCTRSTTRGR